MVGQETILNRINDFNISTFPRTLMLIGSIGSGRHTICSMIAERLKIGIVDISDRLSLDTIVEIGDSVEPTLYIIDTKAITTREQNVILKFLEEPPTGSFIVVLAENENLLLETIINRCVHWRLEKYSKDQLKGFSPTIDDYALSLCETPGQVILFNQYNVLEIKELADKILDNIQRATLPNTLTLLDKVGFKGEKDKIDFTILSRVLLDRTHTKIVDNALTEKAHFLIRDLIRKSALRTVNCEYLFAKYLLDLRDLLKGN